MTTKELKAITLVDLRAVRGGTWRSSDELADQLGVDRDRMNAIFGQSEHYGSLPRFSQEDTLRSLAYRLSLIEYMGDF